MAARFGLVLMIVISVKRVPGYTNYSGHGYWEFNIRHLIYMEEKETTRQSKYFLFTNSRNSYSGV